MRSVDFVAHQNTLVPGLFLVNFMFLGFQIHSGKITWNLVSRTHIT